jgi:tetratricopeptide (TPR) repeat protein
LARKLYFAGELLTARSCLDQVEAHAPQSSVPLVELARLRWLLGEYKQAYALSKRAMDSGADTPDANYLHATLAQYNGDIDTARTGLQQSLRKWPRFGEAAVALVHLEKQNSAVPLKVLDTHLALVQADPPGPIQQVAMAQFQAARFKVLDDLGQADKAWQALERGNALMRALYPYDGAGEAAVCEALASASTHLAKRVAHATRDGAQPIFVVGLPRSGTTLLDRALSSHSAIASAGEINDFRRQLRWMTDVPAGGVAGMLEVLRRVETIDFTELGRRYLAQTQWRAPGKHWFVDKNPINVRMVPFIRLALPHAVIVHIHRAPMDVCYSNIKAMLGASSAYSYYMASMAHYYRLYRGLIDRWHRDCPGLLHEVAYEALLRTPVATLTGVLDRCGLELEPACLHPERNATPVATPSCNQVREAPHLRSLGEWRRYEARLEPLRAALNA